MGVRLPPLVAIPAGAGLLAVAAHLAEPVRDQGSAARPAVRGAGIPCGSASRRPGRPGRRRRAGPSPCRNRRARRRPPRPSPLPPAGTGPRADRGGTSGCRRTPGSCRPARRPCPASSPAPSRSRSPSGLVALPRTISSSRMTLAGLKKWWPITCCGRDGRRGDLVDVRASRCWTPGSRRAASPCPARRRPASSAPCPRRPPRRRCRPPRSGRSRASARCSARRRSISSCGQPALLHGGGVVLADGRQAAVEGLLVDLLEEDRDARVGVGHGDAAAHRARADDRRLS